MKLSEAIKGADELRPGNKISNETKRRWLYSLDVGIFENVMLAHEDNASEYPKDYLTEFDPDLLLDNSDAEVYVWYLVAQIDSATGESERYNTSTERYKALYKAFSAKYTREHMPIQKHRLQNVMRIGGLL